MGSINKNDYKVHPFLKDSLHSNSSKSVEMSKMKRNIISLCLFFAFLFLAKQHIFAWDSQRKGFLIEGGLGFGGSSQEVSNSGKSNSFAFVTNFKIGFSPTNSWTISYFHKSVWFNATETVLPSEFGGPITPQEVNFILTNGLAGLGFDYFLKPTNPSWFFSGGFGLGWWAQPFEENTNCRLYNLPVLFPCLETTGVGLVIGGGYEFKKHLALEINVMWSTPNGRTSDLVEVTSNSFHVFVTINYIGY